jgi:hypothetical protein
VFALAASDSLELRRSFITNETELDARRAHRDSEGRARGGRRRAGGQQAQGRARRTFATGPASNSNFIQERKQESRKRIDRMSARQNPRRLPLLLRTREVLRAEAAGASAARTRCHWRGHLALASGRAPPCWRAGPVLQWRERHCSASLLETSCSAGHLQHDG